MDTAVILAAGKGSKIYPFSETMPKAALPLGDKSVIEYQVTTLKKLGLRKIIVVVGHLKGQIYSALKDFEDIMFIEDREILGTAKSLLNVLKHFEDLDKFLVIYGDIFVSEETLKKVIDKAKRGADYVALTVPLRSERPNDWICSKNNGDEIEYVLAHARHRVSHRLGGIYVLNSGFRKYLESNPGFMLHVPVGVMPPREFYLEESIAIAIDDGEIFKTVEPDDDFFVDIDKPWHIIEANMKYLDYFFSKLEKSIIEENANISEDAEILGKIVAKSGSKIKKGAEIRGGAIIGRNTIIGKCILNGKVSINDYSIVDEFCRIESHTVVGKKVKILHAAEVGGVIMDGVSIVHYSEIYGVIGRYTDIGAATVVGTLKFDDSPALIRIKGRKEFPPRFGNGAYIGDFCRTGVNAIIMPGVRVGPYSAIGPGVILYEDIPPRTLVLAKQELIKKEWGPEKYGW